MKKIILISMLAVAFVVLKGQTPYQDTYTKSLTNDSLTITGAEGFHFITLFVKPTSTANATIKSLVSNGTIGGKAISEIALPPGTTFTIPINDKLIRNLRIIAPANDTVLIFGIKYGSR